METPDLLALCLAVLPPVTPQSFWYSWVLAPETLLPVLALFLLPWLLPWLLPSFRAAGRADQRYWQLGCILLVVALVSPLCRLAATLAWAHMVQHLILIILAPLPMALGLRPLLRRRHYREGLASFATLLLAGAIWVSHAPVVYEAALSSKGLHLAVLAWLFASALLFWVSAVSAPSLRAMSMVFVTILHSGLLGALLTFSTRLWYPVFGAGPQLWGLTPMEDQQLAGLIMWVPMGLILAVIGLWLWLGELLLNDETSSS